MPGSSVRLSPRALSQDLGQELFIIDLATQRYYSLDELGSRIWSLLREHGDVERTVSQILAEYAVDRDTVIADVDKLVAHLAAKGLVEVDQ